MDLARSAVPNLLNSDYFPFEAILVLHLSAADEPYTITPEQWSKTFYRMDALSLIEEYPLNGRTLWMVSFQNPETLTDDRLRALFGAAVGAGDTRSELVLPYDSAPDDTGAPLARPTPRAWKYGSGEEALTRWRTGVIETLRSGTGEIRVGDLDLFGEGTPYATGDECWGEWNRWVSEQHIRNNPDLSPGVKRLLVPHPDFD